MTYVDVKKDGKVLTVHAKGHATGSVQVCAAVSTIMQGLECYLANSRIKVFEDKCASGDCLVSFSLKSSEARVIARYALMGIAQLVNSYPMYIDSNAEDFLEDI